MSGEDIVPDSPDDYHLEAMTIEQYWAYLVGLEEKERIKVLDWQMDFLHRASHAMADEQNLHMLIGVMANRLGGRVEVPCDSTEEMGKVLLAIEEDEDRKVIVINVIKEPV